VNGSEVTEKIGATPQVHRISALAEIQTYRASRLHLRATFRICASRKGYKKPQFGLARGINYVAQTIVAIKFQDRICSRIARLCGILATEG